MPLFELDHVLSLVLGHLGKDISQRLENSGKHNEEKANRPKSRSSSIF